MLLAVVVLGCARDDAELEHDVALASSLLERLGLEAVDPPQVTASKSVRYVTATATAVGDQRSVVDSIAAGLAADGWEILATGPFEAPAGPATERSQVRARKEDRVVQLGVYDRVGTRAAPPGGRWVQLSLSPPDEPLSSKREP